MQEKEFFCSNWVCIWAQFPNQWWQFFIYPIWIFFARTIDRFGKGIRTGARDALLSDEATSETKGQVFGSHRSMDTLGAVIGLLSLALIYLYFYPQDYKTLFFIAFIPGLLAVLASFFLKEKVRNVVKPKSITPFFSFLNYWKYVHRNIENWWLVFLHLHFSIVRIYFFYLKQTIWT